METTKKYIVTAKDFYPVGNDDYCLFGDITVKIRNDFPLVDINTPFSKEKMTFTIINGLYPFDFGSSIAKGKALTPKEIIAEQAFTAQHDLIDTVNKFLVKHFDGSRARFKLASDDKRPWMPVFAHFRNAGWKITKIDEEEWEISAVE